MQAPVKVARFGVRRTDSWFPGRILSVRYWTVPPGALVPPRFAWLGICSRKKAPPGDAEWGCRQKEGT